MDMSPKQLFPGNFPCNLNLKLWDDEGQGRVINISERGPEIIGTSL